MVRISGPRVLEVARTVFTPRTGWRSFPPEPRRALVGHSHRPGAASDPIDQALLLFFQQPRSYTGEDVVEITAHGGPLIMKAILEASLEAGARLADPGEFTRRAFLNGRMDLSQAEAVARLVHASTDQARRVMLRQVEGATGREAAAIRRNLLEVKALLEASIDFPEEIEGDIQPGRALECTRNALALTRKLLSTAREGIALSEGLSAVIIGTPNVGKSSILNALLGEERAIVHEMAGTTRDFIEGRIDAHGIPVKVVDTAGIREAADGVEVEGVLRTRRMMERADLLLIILDSSRPPGRGDMSLLGETEGVARVIVANKSDLHPADAGPPGGAVSVSAKTGHGLEDLKAAIHRHVLDRGGEPVGLEGGVVTSVRQAEALNGLKEACERAAAGLEGGVDPELVAVDVGDAMMRIGELTGEMTADMVLDEIFSRFCIGK